MTNNQSLPGGLRSAPWLPVRPAGGTGEGERRTSGTTSSAANLTARSVGQPIAVRLRKLFLDNDRAVGTQRAAQFVHVSRPAKVKRQSAIAGGDDERGRSVPSRTPCIKFGAEGQRIVEPRRETVGAQPPLRERQHDVPAAHSRQEGKRGGRSP